MTTFHQGLLLARVAIAVNVVLAVVKVVAGLIGNSYALIADGIESTTDIVSSLIVWSGLRWSAKPPDTDHPYGHGKAESLAGFIAAAALLGSAAIIAANCVREILAPHHAPAPFTLIVLLVVIVVKETLYRVVSRAAHSLESMSLRSDAWHHRSDALTSCAVFVGIGISTVGGPGYEASDDWAALLACGIIVLNAFRLLRPAFNEVMDAAAPPEVEREVRTIAQAVAGVLLVEKCRIRKSGMGLLMDLHVTVDGGLSVREGHAIGHQVKDALIKSHLRIHDVVVHLEPDFPPATAGGKS